MNLKNDSSIIYFSAPNEKEVTRPIKPMKIWNHQYQINNQESILFLLYSFENNNQIIIKLERLNLETGKIHTIKPIKTKRLQFSASRLIITTAPNPDFPLSKCT